MPGRVSEVYSLPAGGFVFDTTGDIGTLIRGWTFEGNINEVSQPGDALTSEKTFQFGRKYSGQITLAADCPEFTNLLLGSTYGVSSATNASFTGYKSETLTAVALLLTLTGVPADLDGVWLLDLNEHIFLKKVAAGPADGEFSIVGAAVTINVAQTGDTFYCFYWVAEAAGATSVLEITGAEVMPTCDLTIVDNVRIATTGATAVRVSQIFGATFGKVPVADNPPDNVQGDTVLDFNTTPTSSGIAKIYYPVI